MYYVLYIIYYIKYILYIIYFLLFIIYFTLYIIYYISYFIYFIYFIFYILYIIYYILYIILYLLYIIYYILYIYKIYYNIHVFPFAVSLKQRPSYRFSFLSRGQMSPDAETLCTDKGSMGPGWSQPIWKWKALTNGKNKKMQRPLEIEIVWRNSWHSHVHVGWWVLFEGMIHKVTQSHPTNENNCSGFDFRGITIERQNDRSWSLQTGWTTIFGGLSLSQKDRNIGQWRQVWVSYYEIASGSIW